jgi:peroxiredoxin Q/BCP
MLKIGDKIEDFNFTATSGVSAKLSQFTGKNVVLYFYPKDNTPGCTMESKSFRDHAKDFADCDTVIFGISKDSINSHEKFKSKHCMPFELICDNDTKLCQLFDVLKHKSMFGVKYIGIERSTFLIDKTGILRHEWRKVKVLGHVDKVLAAAKSL